MNPDDGLREIDGYLRELEKANRQLAVENAQLRVSHSYRLGNAFVTFAKHKRLGGIRLLLRQIRDAMRPMAAHAPALPRRPAGFHGFKGAGASDSLHGRIDEPPVGTRIARQAAVGTDKQSRLRVVGVIGLHLRDTWGNAVSDGALAFDRYDSQWTTLRPSHLVIDADQLSEAFGWRHVFTLRDPAATVETVAMLHKARRQDIVTVLIEPSHPHRFPLLSRARSLFDIALKPDEATLDRLA